MSAETLFQQAFGAAPTTVASAPGRVNLIGEHTDYNGGFAMPIAITQATTVAVARNGRTELRVASEQVDGGAIQTYGTPDVSDPFASYIQGAFWALQQADMRVQPVDVTVSSEIPIGSGLSSSAALLVATLRAFRDEFGLELSDLELAKLAYRAEREFVGVPVGTMDQMACSLGSPASALLLDTRTLGYELIPLPTDAELVVVDSGVRHRHSVGGYKERRAQCERAAEILGVKWLCDLREPLEELELSDAWQQLEPVLRDRVRHVLTENQRVFAAALAMRNDDVTSLGASLDASHASLRDWFAVSTPEVDALVEALRQQDGCLGARMTGGGFGGAVVAVTRRGMADDIAVRGTAHYVARFRELTPKVICPTVRGGSL